MLTLTRPQILEDVAAIVAEVGVSHTAGDGKALYFHGDGRPCCFVGHVLYRHGLRIEDLVDTDEDPSSINDEDLRVLVLCRIVHLDDEAEVLLRDLQRRSDDGDPWGLIANDITTATERKSP